MGKVLEFLKSPITQAIAAWLITVTVLGLTIAGGTFRWSQEDGFDLSFGAPECTAEACPSVQLEFEEQIADTQAQLAGLRAQLDAADAELTRTRSQVESLQNQLSQVYEGYRSFAVMIGAGAAAPGAAPEPATQ